MRTLGFNPALTLTAQQEKALKAVADTWLLVPAGTTLSSCPWRSMGAKPCHRGTPEPRASVENKTQWRQQQLHAEDMKGAGEAKSESQALESKHYQLAWVSSSLQPLGGLLGPRELDSAIKFPQNMDAIGLSCAKIWGGRRSSPTRTESAHPPYPYGAG